MMNLKNTATSKRLSAWLYAPALMFQCFLKKVLSVRIIMILIMSAFPFSKAFADTTPADHEIQTQSGTIYITEGTIVKNIDSIAGNIKYIDSSPKLVIKKSKYLTKIKNAIRKKNKDSKIASPENIAKSFWKQSLPISTSVAGDMAFCSVTVVQNDLKDKKKHNYTAYILSDFHPDASFMLPTKESNYLQYYINLLLLELDASSIRPPPFSV